MSVENISAEKILDLKDDFRVLSSLANYENNAIYISGGRDWDTKGFKANYLASVVVYRLDTNKFETAPSMETAREKHGSVALGGKVYVFGGTGKSEGEMLKSIEYLIVAKGFWCNLTCPIFTAREKPVVCAISA